MALVESPDLPITKVERQILALVEQVRLFVRDYPELNRLVKGKESSDRMIAWAIQDAVDDWNSTPPLITYVDALTHPSTSLLIRGAAIALLQSVGILQTRNHLSYSDGSGVSVNSSDKAPVIQSWLQLFMNYYEQKKKQMKIALNIEGAWGGSVHSELILVNAYYALGGD